MVGRVYKFQSRCPSHGDCREECRSQYEDEDPFCRLVLYVQPSGALKLFLFVFEFFYNHIFSLQ